MTENLPELYLSVLLRDTKFHGEMHLLDIMDLLGLVVTLDEESEGIESEMKMSINCLNEIRRPLQQDRNVPPRGTSLCLKLLVHWS